MAFRHAFTMLDMPILEVEIVVESAADLAPNLAQSLADAAGTVFDADSGRVWVRLRSLDKTRYAENQAALPAGVLPAFVKVILAKPPSGPALADQAADLARAIAQALHRPQQNIHILYEPPALGRIAFGGKLYTQP